MLALTLEKVQMNMMANPGERTAQPDAAAAQPPHAHDDCTQLGRYPILVPPVQCRAANISPSTSLLSHMIHPDRVSRNP